jgi:hypothetical protein
MCKDTCENIYKICNCTSSTLCYSCLMITNTTNICKCPICRTDLKIKYNRDYYKLFSLVAGYILLHLAVIGIPLIYPIYSYTNNCSDLSPYVLILSMYSIFIIEPSMCKIILKNLRIKYVNYQLSKLIFTVFFIPFIFLLKEYYRDLLYILICIFPLYILPNISYTLVNIYNKLKEVKEYLNEKTKTKQIMFQIINYEINENNINIISDI